MAVEANACDLCGREVLHTTRHHLVPRSRSSKRKRRGQVEAGPSRREVMVKGKVLPAPGVTIGLCKACHGMVHAVLSEKELERDYHTLEALRAHPEIAKFAAWAARQPADRRIAIRGTKQRKSSG